MGRSPSKLAIPLLSLLAAVALGALTGLLPLVGCQQQASPDPAMPEALEKGLASPHSARFLGCCDPHQPFTLETLNPWYPLAPGNTWLFEGEEDGVPIRVEIEVLAETEQVGDVTTRVVVETESEYDAEEDDWVLVEVSHNYFAMTLAGDVCYFGEAVDIYEDGKVVSHEGAWRADESGNLPGLFMPAAPWPGARFPQECAPGVAEDQALVIGAGPVEVPAGRFTRTIRIREYNPLDGDMGFKVFAYGVGMILDGPLELISYDVAP